MHCPRCGLENSLEHKFCRRCGFSLEKVAELLAESLGSHESEVPDSASLTERLGMIALGTLATVGIGFLLWAIIVKMMIVKGEILFGTVVLTLLLSAVCSLFCLVILPETRKDAEKRRRSIQTSEVDEPSIPRALPEPSFEDVASVTEHTTERLEMPVKKSNRRQTA